MQRMPYPPEPRSVSTRFRVLVEIASRQPSVQQKDVARELGITVQAVSEQFRELTAAGLVASRSRASYSITPAGVDWLLRHARELESYSDRIAHIVRDISVTAALADADLAAGEKVTLEMRDGVLHARPWRPADPVSGVTAAAAKKGLDCGITKIEGVIPLHPSEVVVAVLPAIQDGGSARTDTVRLRRLTKDAQLVATVGVESGVALDLAGVPSGCRWAATAAVIEAASAGLSCVLVCTNSDVPRVAERFAEVGLQFVVIDLALGDPR
jgi:putative transcriptional regulator